MSVINITKENFEQEVLRSEKPVLLDFYADWCGPCRMVAPTVHEIAEENDHIKVGKINVDQQMDLAMRFQVIGPTRPDTLSPKACWNARTAASVWLPRWRS